MPCLFYISLKSHDYHVLMQELLHVVVLESCQKIYIRDIMTQCVHFSIRHM